MVKLLSFFILCYKKLLSPWLGPHCRFYPSCSSYFLQALSVHGALKGTWLGLARICRCNPLSEGGLDPVPETESKHCCDIAELDPTQVSNMSSNMVSSMNKESSFRHGY
ncbi:MAG: membrane protein insertion efficiency factor YidD [Pseudomonadales bacterium]|jgi:putative membrane protein insertion efficiency factor